MYAPAMVAFVGGASMAGEGGKPLAGWIPLGAGEPFYPAYACSRACFTEVNLSNLSDGRSNSRHVSAANYFGFYHSWTGFRSIRYAHQKAATLAVPSDLFAAGGAVTPETVMHPTAQQWRSARILSHPLVAPIVQSVIPQMVSSVPVPAERAPVIVALNPGTTTAPQSGVDQSALQGGTGESGSQAGEKFWLIAHTPPPAAGPTLEQQLPALRQNAGRPLDPGQLENLVAGRVAGPGTVREFPPESTSSAKATGRRTGVK